MEEQIKNILTGLTIAGPAEIGISGLTWRFNEAGICADEALGLAISNGWVEVEPQDRRDGHRWCIAHPPAAQRPKATGKQAKALDTLGIDGNNRLKLVAIADNSERKQDKATAILLELFDMGVTPSAQQVADIAGCSKSAILKLDDWKRYQKAKEGEGHRTYSSDRIDSFDVG